MRPSSWRRTKTSRTARDRPSSRVKRSRLQSQEAPRTFSCSVIREPKRAFHSQTRATKASRPMSWRLLPSVFLSSRSTTIWVAMPAWSVPGSQRVLWPCIRCQRTSRSWMVTVRACPMCSEPVMFGGGMTMEKAGASDASSARK